MARRVNESWVAGSPPVVREVWHYLIRNANHSKTLRNGHTLDRGQLFRRTEDIRDALSWHVGYRLTKYSRKSIEGAMKVLAKERMIVITKEPRGTLITVCNYDRYQDPKNYEGTSEGTCEGGDEGQAKVELGKVGGVSINKNGMNVMNDENEMNGTLFGEPSKDDSPIPSVSKQKKFADPNSPFSIFIAETWKDIKDPVEWEIEICKNYPKEFDYLAQAKLARMWEVGNPLKAKKDHKRFFTNWLSRGFVTWQNGLPSNRTSGRVEIPHVGLNSKWEDRPGLVTVFGKDPEK